MRFVLLCTLLVSFSLDVSSQCTSWTTATSDSVPANTAFTTPPTTSTYESKDIDISSGYEKEKNFDHFCGSFSVYKN